MKKTLVLVLSFMMILTFALAACSGGGGEDLSDSQYVGTWIADTMSIGDTSEGFDGGTFTLTLNGDGTGTFISAEDGGETETSDITWQLTSEGFKTKGDTSLKFTDNGDGTISTKIIGVDLTFVRAGGEEEVVDYIDGAAYGYAGEDPVEAACYQYMAEVVAKDGFNPAEYSIPVVNIIAEDVTPEDEVLVYGDFWIYNYDANGDVLECASGGNFPGVMHVSKDTYEVTAFDPVADGADFEESAKTLFGDNYDAFMAAYGDDENNNELRKITVSDYVNLNGLDFNYYQDYGWDPVELYRN